MLRIRTMCGDSLKFSAENLSFAYGLNGSTSYTEYGYVKGNSGSATFSGNTFYYLSSAGANQTNSATMNFVTTKANQQVTFYIGSQSEANYDWMCLGNLNSDSINKCAARISGNPAITAHTFTISTPGAYYVKLFYKKDQGTNTGNDRGYFRMVPYTNSKSSLDADAETIRIDARKSWSVTSKPNWITLSSTSGAKGVTDIIVTSSVNNSSSNRTGNIVIVDEAGKEYTLAVSQTASVNSVESSRDAFNETYKSGSDTFTVGLNGNTSWSISSYEGTSNFFSISPTTGTTATTATISWNQNSSTTGRQCKVTIKGNLGGTDTINIYQEALYCSCDCEGYCTCDCDVYCLDASYDCDVETHCTCHGQTHCSCHSKTNCNCDDYDYCNCDSKTNCDCDEYGYCNCDDQANCGCYSEDVCKGHCTCNCDQDGCMTDCPSHWYCTCNCYEEGKCTCNCDQDGCLCDCENKGYCTCNCDQDGCLCDCQKEGACTCNCDQDGRCTCNCDQDGCICNCQQDGRCTCDCDEQYACTCNCNQDGCTCNCDQDGRCTCNCHNDGYCTCNCDDYARCGCDCKSYKHDVCGCHSKTIYCTCDGQSFCSCHSKDTCACNLQYNCTCHGETICMCYGKTTCTCNGDCSSDCPSYCRIDRPLICELDGPQLDCRTKFL